MTSEIFEYEVDMKYVNTLKKDVETLIKSKNLIVFYPRALEGTVCTFR